MQKLLTALVAILSFCTMNAWFMPAQAQSPAYAGQNHPGKSEEDSNKKPYGRAANEALIVPPGATWENVDVKDRPLIIQGDVKGSVKAVNSDVTLLPGARIEGGLNISKGSLTVAPVASPALTASVGSILSPSVASNRMERPKTKTGSWFGGQFCLWLLGLAAGVILLLSAPQATSRVAETVSLQPGSSLAIGGVTAAGMFAALAISGIIMNMKSLISLVWMPFLVIIVLASLFLLVTGWLAGMRYVGDKLAQRFGRTDSGTLYGRMALGLSAFFIVNAILGSINGSLGAVGLFAEFVVALMGIGAIVKTGFGRDSDWLLTRFRRSSVLNSRTPKF